MKNGILIALIGITLMTPAIARVAVPVQIFDHPYIQARKKAFETRKSLLIYFISDNCVKCEEQRQMIENDRELARALEAKFETAVVNVNEFDGNAIREIYQVREIPGYLLVSQSGEILWSYQGHISKNDLLHLAGRESSASHPEGVASLDPRPAEPPAPSVPASVKVEQKQNPELIAHPEGTQKNVDLPAFQIQFGFFGSHDNARKLQEKLAQNGQKDCYIEEENRNGKTFYRVLSPLYSSQGDAEMILKLVKQSGMEGTIRQVQ